MKGDVAEGLGRDVAGENDEGNRATEFLPQFLANLDAVHAVGQIVVGKDEIGPDRPADRQVHGGGAIDGGGGVIALFFQEELEVLAHFRIVLDDQDRRRARRGSG